LKSLRLHALNDLRVAPVDGRTGWDRLGVIDWPIARALALSGERRAPLIAANTVSRLGNGPIYFFIVAAVALFHPQDALTIIGCAAASILLLHSVYPTMKQATARPRPRDVEAVFPESIPTLDRYSFPSGHVMTLTAALTPILHSAPKTWPVGVAVWAAMAWSRLAIGHHYASDVAAGTILGAAVSGAVTYCIAA
jgi:undecaprenyl-diphosphatase